MNERYFLGEGRFTKRDNVIKMALEEALSLIERKTDLGKISLYLSKAISTIHHWDESLFRKRTASEIICSKKSNGCSDYGLVFLTLARELGVPSKYVETIEEKNLSNPLVPNISGHIFADIFIDGQWKIYEPIGGFQNSYCLGKMGERKFIPVARGLDFSNLLSNEGKKIKLDTLSKVRAIRNNLSKSFNQQI